MRHPIDPNRRIRIHDDRSKGMNFTVGSVIFADKRKCLATLNESEETYITIDLETGDVETPDFEFYVAENY